MEGSLFFIFDVIICLNTLTRCQPTSYSRLTNASTSPTQHLKDAYNKSIVVNKTSGNEHTKNVPLTTVKTEVEDEDEDGQPYDEEESALHRKASLIVGAIFVPSLVAIYICCRYIPNKVLMYITGE